MKNKNRKIEKRRVGSVVGIVRGSGRGFAFLSREDGEDIFIPAKCLNGAMHGDTVEADVYLDHCEVKRIIKIGFTQITGVYVKDMHAGKVLPDNRRFGDARHIGECANGRQSGDKAIS